MNRKHIQFIAAVWLGFGILVSIGHTAENPRTEDSMSPVEYFIALTREPVGDVRPDLDYAIDVVAEKGDVVIPGLMDAFNQIGQRFGTRHAIVRVLAKIGSDAAKEQLKQIALSEREDVRSNMKEWAASHFVKLIQTKEEAIPLIDSNDAGVRNLGLVTITGIRLNSELLAKIEPLTLSESRGVRRSAATVLGEDPSEEYYEQKVIAVTNALDNFYADEDPNEVSRPGQYNQAQVSLQCYINALSNMKGPIDVLQQRSQEDNKELTSEVLLIARANRNDASVKETIKTIIQTQGKKFIIRMRALESMKNIGSREDIPFLQSIANSDTYQVSVPHGQEPSGKSYPIRQRAESLIKEIRNDPNWISSN